MRHLRQAPGLQTIADRGGRTRGQAVHSRSHRPLRTHAACTAMISAQRSTRGGAGAIRTRSGLDAGGRLRTIRAPPCPGRNHDNLHSATVSRASRPARSRSGARASAGWSKRRRVRAVSARLEDVQKVLTARNARNAGFVASVLHLNVTGSSWALRLVLPAGAIPPALVVVAPRGPRGVHRWSPYLRRLDRQRGHHTG